MTRATKLARSVALIGMMGAGKTTLGRRLAPHLGAPFIDSDAEIEKAAGMSVSDLFSLHGEAAFRAGEARVFERLLAGAPSVIAAGGGAVVAERTRRLLQARALTVWLMAAPETLARRATRRDTRPLLRDGDPEQKLRALLEERERFYREADIHIENAPGPKNETVAQILEAVRAHPKAATVPSTDPGAPEETSR